MIPIQMVRFHTIVVRSALAVVTLTFLGGFACAGTDHTGPGSAMTQVWHTPLGSNTGSYWVGMPALDGGKLFVEDVNNVVAGTLLRSIL